MGWQYNENLYEGLAVVSFLPPTAITSTATIMPPFNSKTLRRVIFDLSVTAGATTAAFTPVLQMSPTPIAASFTAVPTTTSSSGGGIYALPVLNSATSGAIYSTYAVAGTMTTGSTTVGTTAGQFYRFEYDVESLREAIDGTAPTTTSNASTWLTLQITANTTSAATISAVAYGVMGSYPSADIVLNQFTPATTTAVGVPTAVPMVYAQQTFIDGYCVANVPYTTTALATMQKILPV